MLVVIDGSGDAGFKVAKGSSPIFVAAMAIFETSKDAQATEERIRQAKTDLGIRSEFKFNGSSNAVRDGFFQAVRDCPFIVRAVVVHKGLIRSPHLRVDKEDFYRFFIRQMLTNDGDTLTDAKVVIDGSGDREFRRMLRTSLRRQAGARVKSISFSNSKNDLLVQLADMCVGAIARSYRTDRPDRWRWRHMLHPRIGDVWIFQ